MGLYADPNDPCPMGLSSNHLQAYPSGSWMLLLLAKSTSQDYISLSINLWWKNVRVSPSAFQLITRSIIPLQAFLIITFKLSLTDFCCAHPETPITLCISALTNYVKGSKSVFIWKYFPTVASGFAQHENLECISFHRGNIFSWDCFVTNDYTKYRAWSDNCENTPSRSKLPIASNVAVGSYINVA